MAPKIQVFNDYIEKVIPEIKESAEKFEDSMVEWEPLNELFIRIVKQDKRT